MSDLGDIGGILDEKPLANLDWLDVDKEEYRLTEALPKQNLDSIPELEAQWKDLTDADMYRLSPENREVRNPKTPFWSERPTPGELDVSELMDRVERFAAKQIQAGVPGEDLITSLTKTFDSRTLAAAKGRIRAVLAERGLLGTVYLDSELFENCFKGDTSGLRPHNKLAKYAVAKSKCSDCVHNREGRCSVLQKELVFEVNYDQDLVDEYKDKLPEQSRDLQASEGDSAKRRLQKLILASPNPDYQPLDSKPVMPDPTAGVEYGDAVRALQAHNTTQEVLEDPRALRKVRRVAKEMMMGNHSTAIRDLVASDPTLESLRGEIGLLGKLYMDLSYFDTKKEAGEFFAKHANRTPFVKGTPVKSTGKVASSDIDFTSPKVLAVVAKRLLDVRNADASLLKPLCKRLKSAGSTKVRQLAAEAFSTPLAGEKRTYAATAVYDPTQGVTSEEADRKLAEASTNRVKADDPAHQEVVARMLCGDHGKRTATLIETHVPYLAPHLHLMGNLYVDTRLATHQAVKTASTRNPDIADLPVMTANNADGFFMKPEIHALIADRIADHKGAEGTSRIEMVRNLVNVFSDSTEKKVVALAKKAFATPVNVPVVSSKSAAAGQSDMQEFELGVVAQEGTLADFDISSGPEKTLDVDFGAGITLD